MMKVFEKGRYPVRATLSEGAYAAVIDGALKSVRAARLGSQPLELPDPVELMGKAELP